MAVPVRLLTRAALNAWRCRFSWQRVAHFKILERPGGGRMGVVYKTDDIKLKRTVALKFLPVELSKDVRALVRFQAFEFLEKAYRERTNWMPCINMGPRFDAIRSDLRFQTLLRKVNLLW